MITDDQIYDAIHHYFNTRPFNPIQAWDCVLLNIGFGLSGLNVDEAITRMVKRGVMVMNSPRAVKKSKKDTSAYDDADEVAIRRKNQLETYKIVENKS